LFAAKPSTEESAERGKILHKKTYSLDYYFERRMYTIVPITPSVMTDNVTRTISSVREDGLTNFAILT
jgi:hypothetical protein